MNVVKCYQIIIIRRLSHNYLTRMALALYACNSVKGYTNQYKYNLYHSHLQDASIQKDENSIDDLENRH